MPLSQYMQNPLQSPVPQFNYLEALQGLGSSNPMQSPIMGGMQSPGMMGGNGVGGYMPNGQLMNLGGNTNQGGGLMDTLFGNQQTGQMGALAPTAQAISGLASSFMGMKQYGLAKDAFKESKRQFNLNFDAQKKDYNNQLADRQRARLNSSGYGGSRYRSVSEVLEKDGI